MSRFSAWLRRSKPQPQPIPTRPPREDDFPATGSPSNPNWDYIAKNAELDTEGLIDGVGWYIAKYNANAELYFRVAQEIGCPPWFVGALHMREDGYMRTTTALHNGELLTDVNKYGTRWVPKGRGQGQNWDWADAAIDALKLKGYHLIDKNDWSLGKMCARAEVYNGLGYRKTGEYSPYVCAGTTFHDETGKYVADGKYSSTAREGQLGVLAFWLALGVRRNER